MTAGVLAAPAARMRAGPEPLATRGVTALAVFTAVLLLPWSGRYGYNVDELYFRMLGRNEPAWGYVDQPPLVPLLARISIDVFGDTVAGMRAPAPVCAALIVVIGALITAELGGGRRAQLLCAAGLGTSSLVLAVGHVLVTTTLDMTAWALATLFAVRALLRADGRWWVAVGVTCGLATYSKYIILLWPVALLAGLVLVGPRSWLRDRWLYLGAFAGLLSGAPNLVYQLTHGFPQLAMTRALGSTDGVVNRVIFLPSLPLVLGLALTPIWVAGLLGLLRDPRWRPVRAVAVAALVGGGLLLVGGGRPDYAGGFLIGLLAAGSVATARWLDRGRWRRPVLAGGLALSALMQIVVALPVLPERSLATVPLNNISLESVGWPELVAQVAAVHDRLPPDERARAVLLAANFGQAGAIDRYGPAYRLPAVYSGHNELHRLGPPPESSDVVVAVGVDEARLRAGFTDCRLAGRVDNGIGVPNAEQGMPIRVCRGRLASWAELWPAYRYLSG